MYFMLTACESLQGGRAHVDVCEQGGKNLIFFVDVINGWPYTCTIFISEESFKKCLNTAGFFAVALNEGFQRPGQDFTTVFSS